jgi:hypothetical protein
VATSLRERSLAVANRIHLTLKSTATVTNKGPHRSGTGDGGGVTDLGQKAGEVAMSPLRLGSALLPGASVKHEQRASMLRHTMLFGGHNKSPPPLRGDGGAVGGK